MSCQYAFESAKRALLSNNVVVHYSPKLLVKLTADASSYDVGAVISHRYAQLLLPPGHSLPVRRTIPNWKKRL